MDTKQKYNKNIPIIFVVRKKELRNFIKKYIKVLRLDWGVKVPRPFETMPEVNDLVGFDYDKIGRIEAKITCIKNIVKPITKENRITKMKQKLTVITCKEIHIDVTEESEKRILDYVFNEIKKASSEEGNR